MLATIPMRVRLAGWSVHTETGRLREHNEDAVLAAPPLFAVADGVGSRPSGEVASALALAVLRVHVEGSPARLREAVSIADRAVRVAGMTDRALTGMATTLTAGLVHPRGVTVVHAGHSHAYRLRRESLELMTRDDRASSSRLSQYVGSGDVEPQVVEATACPGDVWLLCSNGLTDAIGVEGIIAAMSSGVSIYDAAGALAALARSAGNDDVAIAAFRIA